MAAILQFSYLNVLQLTTYKKSKLLPKSRKLEVLQMIYYLAISISKTKLEKKLPKLFLLKHHSLLIKDLKMTKRLSGYTAHTINLIMDGFTVLDSSFGNHLISD